ncbi:MAG: tyrosine-type recombinase/integrase [Planctomycetaceae bacterium]|nr:tyrosine-type recombinase/integrase [Planctomycetaceae bacterium]
MKAWVFQYPTDVRRKGADGASFYCGWVDPAGKRKAKSFGPGERGRKAAEKQKQKTEAQLLTGTYQSANRTTWKQFREEYARTITDGMDIRNREAAESSLAHFERVIKPAKMDSIKTATVLEFAAKRAAEGVAPATVNKELRYVRAALRAAMELEFLAKLPTFKQAWRRESKRLPTFIAPDQFSAVYHACKAAQYPTNLPNTKAEDWWQALLVFAYLTGWRIGQILALRWEDVDLEAATALSRADDNKGRRDVRIPLHPIVIQHLQKLRSTFALTVFPWNHALRTLWVEFGRLQESAGLPETGCGKNDGRFGFHDLRRGFASLNAGTMAPEALQALMQHKSFTTTLGYINIARQLSPAVEKLFVPELTPPTTAASL